MRMTQGFWLGIDVGCSREKVFNFCLVHSDGAGAVQVWFERGAARDGVYPHPKAGVFEDLGRPTWLSAPAETGAIQILERSALTQRWIDERALCRGHCGFGVCIDAPSGFAVPFHDRRDTEAQGVANFGTPSLHDFYRRLGDFSSARNNLPLQQRYFWRLIGLVAFRYFIRVTTGAGFNIPPADVTAASMDFLISRTGAARLSRRAVVGQTGIREGWRTRIREGFPSDTYKRANGTLDVFGPEARAVLSCLANAEWEARGNVFEGKSSQPTRQRMRPLLRHQEDLLRDLAQGVAMIPAMQKVRRDPPWADLWDAFTCAFVACCEFHFCGGFVGLDPRRMMLEGAILRPTGCRATRSRRGRGRHATGLSRQP
jgi:hypothetical protein